MHDVDVQLRDYFEAAVERVTVDDVIARGLITAPRGNSRSLRRYRPVAVSAGAFAATLLILGGSLLLGLALRRGATGADAGSLLSPGSLGDSSVSPSFAWILLLAVAVLIATATALVVKSHNETRRERTMTSTLEREPATRLETTRKTTRRLAASVVILAMALVVLGAWVAFDLASEPATAPTDEVIAAYDAYIAAWEAGDADAFLGATAEGYTFSSMGSTTSRVNQANIVGTLSAFQHETIGDMIATGDGPEYYLASAASITWLGATHDGVSAFRIVDTDDGLKVLAHAWIGDF